MAEVLTTDRNLLKEILTEVMRELNPVTKTVTVSEAAKMIGCSINHVYDLISEGELSVKFSNGRQVRPTRVTVESIKDL